MTAKYKNLKELADAFNSGELKNSEYYIELDKGGAMIALRAHYTETMTDADYEAACVRAKTLFASVYDGDSPSPIELALEALGVPCEWC
jgi:hypothetical protein